ncbi:DUF3408 domain-containing protein [uncultured Alistipes sp.]|jgi:hypothetical protein|uniref:DUF3408 domain-containing protein n=1 Tax=uncultured Alistipes sp. TaxID=538949 RepID=UPI0025F94D45|nr:DUF3408 domain-containing protein [uncultured Alistipes sp.]
MTRKSKVEVDEALMRKMIAGEVPLSTNVMREVQEPERKTEDRANTAVWEITQQPATAPETRRRRTTAIPDFEQTFMTPMEIRQRAALYVSIETKRKILEVVKKIGGEYMTATSYVENILRQHLELYKDDINRIHKEQNTKELL